MRIKMIDYTIMIITAEHDNIYAIQYNNPKWNETKCCEFFQLVVFNKWQNTNYSFLPVTSKVSCIRKKRGQIICLQGNN
jgi:hypothetical protein